MKPFFFPAIGLDISDESLKFAHLTHERGVRRIDFFGEESMPAGLIEFGEIKDVDGVAKVIRGALTKYKSKIPYLVMSLPEEKGFLRIIKMQHVKPEETREALGFQLEAHIPHPASDLVFDYDIVGSSPEIDTVVTAYPKGIVYSYVGAAQKAGFIPIVFELESQAIARAVVPPHFDGACVVGDIGRTRTTFSIAFRGSVQFTSTVKIGGRDIDLVLMKSLHLSEKEAADVKIGRGFDFSSEDIIKSLSPLLSTLKDEADRQLGFWERRYEDTGVPLSKVYLCGGDALLKGLPEFLSRELDIPVERARVWENLFDINQYIPTMNVRDTLRYATVFGLALRSGNIFSQAL